jgi:hypothetical protein
MTDRYAAAEWLEWSGLPAALNAARPPAWPVFKKIVEMDCRRNRNPEAVECSLGELAERCGMEWEKTARAVEALRRKKVLKCFIPDNPDEPGLYRVAVPIRTPKSPEEVARGANDPLLRDPTTFRYVEKPPDPPEQTKKVQRIIDHYLNVLSQKMNSFIVDEIEVLAERFTLEAIERTIDRGAKHEIQSIGWVARELIRDAKRPPAETSQKR